jgi:dipeptidyl aminopeptidase/acylaminoacyl peptidase
MKTRVVILAVGFAGAGLAWGQAEFKPAPESIQPFFKGRPMPRVSLSPDSRHLLIAQGVRFQRIQDLSQPYLGLAGVRINPVNNGPAHPVYYREFRLLTLADGKEQPLPMPGGLSRFSLPMWSPDGSRFACLRYLRDRVELWVGNPSRRTLAPLKNIRVNAAFGRPFQWLPDGKNILCQVVSGQRGVAPRRERVAPGPLTQDTRPDKAPLRRSTDGLKDDFDRKQFIYFCQAELEKVEVDSGRRTRLRKLGRSHAPGEDLKPTIFFNYDVSPSGQHILVERLHPPFTLHVPARMFARSVEVWTFQADVKRAVPLTLAETIPLGGVQRRPRGHHWRPTAPDTLVWIEALDKGDPEQPAEFRDRIMMLLMQDKAEARELVRLPHRFSRIYWGEDPQVALVREYISSENKHRTWRVHPGKRPEADSDGEPKETIQLLWELSAQDRYRHPGSPLMRQLPNGKRAMRVVDGSIFLNGWGASPDGDHPFLDRYHLKTAEKERLFECGEEGFEAVVAMINDNGAKGVEFITHYEAPRTYPNYYRRTAGEKARRPLTRFKDPVKNLRVQKKLVTYFRTEEKLSCMLYLPPGYDIEKSKPLPTILWVYPRQYTRGSDAGQVAGNTRRFDHFTGADPRFLTLEGYAVIDLALPVVGDQETANDKFIAQIVSSAEAAVDQVSQMGIADLNRIGVGGHSYGAFATVTLLAHSHFFRAGVAQSGAYNRTLTPFGFQNERRTLWEAPNTYRNMSPLFDVPKIRDPLLLIHGLEDDNAATTPTQSQQLFQALKGQADSKARLVLLPHEAHAYRTRESIEHVLHEMVGWFDEHVKNRKPAAGTERPQPTPVPGSTTLPPGRER